MTDICLFIYFFYKSPYRLIRYPQVVCNLKNALATKPLVGDLHFPVSQNVFFKPFSNVALSQCFLFISFVIFRAICSIRGMQKVMSSKRLQKKPRYPVVHPSLMMGEHIQDQDLKKSLVCSSPLTIDSLPVCMATDIAFIPPSKKAKELPFLNLCASRL